jgi:hypothetical protein
VRYPDVSADADTGGHASKKAGIGHRQSGVHRTVIVHNPDLSIKRATCGDEIASPNGAEHRMSRGLISVGGAPPIPIRKAQSSPLQRSYYIKPSLGRLDSTYSPHQFLPATNATHHGSLHSNTASQHFSSATPAYVLSSRPSRR